MAKPAVILDFGNVIGFFDHARAYARFAARLGVESADLRRQLHERGFSALLADFETGRVTSADFARQTSDLVGLEIPQGEFERDWGDIFWPNESIVDVVTALHDRGHPLALGSNTNAIHADWFRRQFAATLARFDALVLSYQIGVMKPDASFYQACTRALDRPVTDCVFVDDIAENVAGARDAGLAALLYTSTPRLVTGLAALGIETIARNS